MSNETENLDDVTEEETTVETEDNKEENENKDSDGVSAFETKAIERDANIVDKDATYLIQLAETDEEHAEKVANKLGYTLEKALAIIRSQMEGEDKTKAEKDLEKIDLKEQAEKEAESRVIAKFAIKQLKDSEDNEKAVALFNKLTKGKILTEDDAEEIVELVLTKYPKGKSNSPRVSLNNPPIRGGGKNNDTLDIMGIRADLKAAGESQAMIDKMYPLTSK